MRHLLSLLCVCVLAVGACSDPAAAPTPVALATFTRGPDSLVAPGTRFDTLVVTARGPRGEPVAGARLTWSGDGEIVPIDEVTRADGTARVRWTLPRFREPGDLARGVGNGPSGTYQLRAESAGETVAETRTTARAFVIDSVSAAYTVACGLRPDGVWCWGYSLRDLVPERLGAPRPQRIAVPGRPAAVQVTDRAICVIDADGTVRCTAPETGRQFAAISGLPAVKAMAGFDAAWCALAAVDGTVWCWNILQGTAASPLAGSGALTTITAGRSFWCGLRADGTPVCWGSNDRGQFGDGTTTPRPTPTPIEGVPPLVRLIAGFTGACGLTAGGDVWCWGEYFRSGAERSPIRLALGEPVLRMDVNDTDVFLRMSGGRLRYFHLGVERPLSWVGNLGDLTVTAISGRESICVTTVSGEVHCSATLSNGVIATQLTPSELTPVPLPAQP